jgi:hypothetical protein
MLFEDGVIFTATLANVSTSSVTVSALDEGNVLVESLRMGSTQLQPSISRALFDDDISVIDTNLITLGPGQSVQFQITGVQRPVQDSTGRLAAVIEYQPSSSATYTVTFEYEFMGSDNGQPSVYHGVLTSNAAVFNVQ